MVLAWFLLLALLLRRRESRGSRLQRHPGIYHLRVHLPVSVKAAAHLKYSPCENESSDKKPNIRDDDWIHKKIVSFSLAYIHPVGVPIVVFKRKSVKRAGWFIAS
jgi:hypothetical protein